MDEFEQIQKRNAWTNYLLIATICSLSGMGIGYYAGRESKSAGYRPVAIYPFDMGADGLEDLVVESKNHHLTYFVQQTSGFYKPLEECQDFQRKIRSDGVTYENKR